jgi:hypothetical protein
MNPMELPLFEDPYLSILAQAISKLIWKPKTQEEINKSNIPDDKAHTSLFELLDASWVIVDVLGDVHCGYYCFLLRLENNHMATPNW